MLVGCSLCCILAVVHDHVVIITTTLHVFNGPFSGTTQVSWYQKGKPIWILLKQETVSGSGISWAICKSAPCSRQITMPAPHHLVFLHLAIISELLLSTVHRVAEDGTVLVYRLTRAALSGSVHVKVHTENIHKLHVRLGDSRESLFNSTG